MDSEGTLTLFAQWKPITYFVHFDGNLADGPAMQSIEATYGQAFYLPETRLSSTTTDWQIRRLSVGTRNATDRAIPMKMHSRS